MSFATTDLMTQVLPERAYPQPGLGLCTQATKNDQEDDCGEATRGGGGSNVKLHLRERDLASLRLQLRQTLGS